MLHRGFSCKGSYRNHNIQSIKKLCLTLSAEEKANLRALILAKINLLEQKADEQSLRLVLKHLGKEE